jgi:hypothetical protein
MTLSDLSVAQWYASVSAAIRADDMEAAAGLIQLMAVHGHPHEAEELRALILLAAETRRESGSE